MPCDIPRNRQRCVRQIGWIPFPFSFEYLFNSCYTMMSSYVALRVRGAINAHNAGVGMVWCYQTCYLATPSRSGMTTRADEETVSQFHFSGGRRLPFLQHYYYYLMLPLRLVAERWLAVRVSRASSGEQPESFAAAGQWR